MRAGPEVFLVGFRYEKGEEPAAAVAPPSPFWTKFRSYLPQAEDIRK